MARKKEGRVVMISRVASETPAKIKEIAAGLGFVYAGDGSQGKLLDAIARGEIKLKRSTLSH